MQKKDDITGLVTRTWLVHHIVVNPGCSEVKVQCLLLTFSYMEGIEGCLEQPPSHEKS